MINDTREREFVMSDYEDEGDDDRGEESIRMEYRTTVKLHFNFIIQSFSNVSNSLLLISFFVIIFSNN